MEINKITQAIIGAAIEVHKELGPGLLESAYQECLYFELLERGLSVQKELELPVVYKEVHLDCGYRIDLFVENEVIVELKSVKELEDIHIAQTLTYLKLSNKKIGLLINFNETKLMDGLRRLINKFHEE